VLLERIRTTRDAATHGTSKPKRKLRTSDAHV
jgi:hypothetical protein